jgi:hypothetical protein
MSMRIQTSAEMAGPGGDGPPASPACPGSGPDGASADRWAPGQAQSAGEFLYRFGDAIDDRVAEILDERDALRPRLPRGSFAVVALLPAMTATILLRHEAAAVCAVWLSAAVACLAVFTTRPGRP